jgi:hypothetical protein
MKKQLYRFEKTFQSGKCLSLIKTQKKTYKESVLAKSFNNILLHTLKLAKNMKNCINYMKTYVVMKCCFHCENEISFLFLEPIVAINLHVFCVLYYAMTPKLYETCCDKY